MRPTGTVTFLFSDIDGSTRLLRSIGVQRYEKAIAQHRLLLREAFARPAGYEVDTQAIPFSSHSPVRWMLCRLRWIKIRLHNRLLHGWVLSRSRV